MNKVKQIPDFKDPYSTVETIEYNDYLDKVTVKYGARDELNRQVSANGTEGIWTAYKDRSHYYVVYWKLAKYEGSKVKIDVEKDFIKSLKQREECIRKAKETNKSGKEKIDYYKGLMNEWKSIKHFHISLEDQLWKSFQNTIQSFYDQLHEENKLGTQKKQELIEKAHSFLNSDNYDADTKKVLSLQKQWKELGYTGKDDYNLYQKFKKECDEFFALKKEYFKKNIEPLWNEAKAKKEKLIEEAVEACNLEDLQEAQNILRRLMVLWKEAGYAGRDDQKLWQQFNTHQNVFYHKKQVFYQEKHKDWDNNYKAKKELIEEADRINKDASYDHDYNHDRTERMKEIMNQFKGIGVCGRERDNQLWTSLRKSMDQYFDELRKYASFRYLK
ncbi:DUF349 domain-containing protein [Eggerthia catenaformis]|uniref:DUF349 domain-containing protein n=1 Tax=Eggerthia catenaformis TaxID=31973 RepID=UPI0028E68187|nr:DUF349 domain-containing protein [Eggerthia catenaformis]